MAKKKKASNNLIKILMLLVFIVVAITLIVLVNNRIKIPSQSNNDGVVATDDVDDNSDMKELTEEEQKNYEISDVKVAEDDGITTITGKIANNGKETKKVVINIKFYSDDDKITGATSEKVVVNAKEVKDFSMMIQDSLSKYKYDIIAEYSN